MSKKFKFHPSKTCDRYSSRDEEDRGDESLTIGVPPSRSRPACLSYHSRSPFISSDPRMPHNAADFVSVAWRSRKVFQRVYARVQRELGRASASLDIKETPRRRRLHRISRTSSRRDYLSAQRVFSLFIHLPLARCLPVVFPILTLHLALLIKYFSPFPCDESFPVKFLGSLRDTNK